MTSRFSKFTVLALGSICSTAKVYAQHPLDLAAEYTYVRTNLAPGCACFGLHGGSLQASVPLSTHWEALADFTFGHAAALSPDGYSLTQLDYGIGARFLMTRKGVRTRPFLETTLGGAHASGSLSPSQTGLGSSNAFRFAAGGGVRIALGARIAIVPAEANYLLTTFSNGLNNRQNELRLSAGIVFRLTR